MGHLPIDAFLLELAYSARSDVGDVLLHGSHGSEKLSSDVGKRDSEEGEAGAGRDQDQRVAGGREPSEQSQLERIQPESKQVRRTCWRPLILDAMMGYWLAA